MYCPPTLPGPIAHIELGVSTLVPQRSIVRALGTIAALACATAHGRQSTTGPAEPPASASPASTVETDQDPYEGRLIQQVKFEGLARVTEQFARNQIRSVEGRPYARATAQDDLRRLERLGQFRDIQVEVQVLEPELNIVLVFKVVEAPIVRDVSVTGNRQIPDQDIRQTLGEVISLIAGVPIDDYQIGRAQRAIEELYRNKGYYLAQVTVDESELEETGEIIFRVREGERIKVTSIRFRGNEAVPDRVLRVEMKTKTAGIFDRAALDAVKRWRYEPRVVGGNVVEQRVEARLRFRLAE